MAVNLHVLILKIEHYSGFSQNIEIKLLLGHYMMSAHRPLGTVGRAFHITPYKFNISPLPPSKASSYTLFTCYCM